MAEFDITPNNLENAISAFKQLKSEAENIQNDALNVANNLYFSDGSAANFISRIKNTAKDIKNESVAAGNMSGKLENIVKEYVKTEAMIVSAASDGKISLSERFKAAIDTSFVTTSSGPSASASASSEFNKDDDGFGWSGKAEAEAEANVWSGGASLENEFFSVDAEGKALHAEADASAGFNFFGDGDKNVNAYAKAHAEAAVAQGEVDFSVFDGLATYKASGEVLAAAATANASINLYREGILVPGAQASAKAEAYVAHGKNEGQLGIDDFNAHGSAEGSVLGAYAKAEAGVGFMENGKVGLYAEAGAGAYLAKGEVKGGFTIFGIDVDVKAGGSIEAGANAGVKFVADKHSVDLGAKLAAVLGLDVEISIDWSDFNIDLW